MQVYAEDDDLYGLENTQEGRGRVLTMFVFLRIQLRVDEKKYTYVAKGDTVGSVSYCMPN